MFDEGGGLDLGGVLAAFWVNPDSCPQTVGSKAPLKKTTQIKAAVSLGMGNQVKDHRLVHHEAGKKPWGDLVEGFFPNLTIEIPSSELCPDPLMLPDSFFTPA